MAKRTPMVLSEVAYNALKIQKKLIYVADIKLTLKSHNKNTRGKKAELISRLDAVFSDVIEYRGPSFDQVSDITNIEDFYTFQSIDEISPEYIFTYKSRSGFIYGFDIRSFHKLIENTKFNPYNREDISQDVVDRMNNRLNQLKALKFDVEIEKDVLTPEQTYNAKIVAIFQKMDALNTIAGGTDPRWFMDLSFDNLKLLYRVLEDIWNYRAELSHSKKNAIVPNNNIFTHNMQIILNMAWSSGNQRWLQHIILDTIDSLVSSAADDVNKRTGCYYVLIAFTEVNPIIAAEMPWLNQ
jgi:hypothetical protein